MFLNKLYGVFIALAFCLFPPVEGHCQEGKERTEFEIISVGIRGGFNPVPGGIPPGEYEDFQQYDVFGIVGFPGKWDTLWGVEGRYLWYTSAGIIRAAGDEGFITTFGPGLAFTKLDWNLTLEMGTGGVVVSDDTFGVQDFGGKVQFLAHGALSYHFPQQISLGWRFQHFSDATLYGRGNRGIDFHFLELRYGF